MVIDLHLTEEIINSSHFDPKFSLDIQIDYLERKIDESLVMGYENVTIIHGIGEGILKKEVHKFLKSHPHIGDYVNEYHPLYGFGSTVANFK